VAEVVAAEAAAAEAAAKGTPIESSVLFCSTHLYEHFDEHPDYDFFPGRGGPSHSGHDARAPAAGWASILNLPLEPLWVRGSRKADVPRGRKAFRAAVSDKLLPALAAFAPDLLLLSAGFDGAAGDDGNAQDECAARRPSLCDPHAV
jgi:acetoin utilization deacetylase AcuC-like enzyme